MKSDGLLDGTNWPKENEIRWEKTCARVFRVKRFDEK